MKRLCLFILTFAVLYNVKVEAIVTSNDKPNTVHPMESHDREIESIEPLTENPLNDLGENIKKYRDLVEIYQNLRKYDIELASMLVGKIQNNQTFSGDDLYMIKRAFEYFYQLNKKMMDFGDLYELQDPHKKKRFNHSERAQEVSLGQLKSQLIWTSSYLILLDHIQMVYKLLYLEDGGLRRIFKNIVADKKSDFEYNIKLKQLTNQINGIIEVGESKKFLQKIIFFREMAQEMKMNLEEDENSLALLREINSNPTATEIAQGKIDFKISVFGLEDAIVGFFNKVTNFLSGFFGNAAGSVRWRKGFLYNNHEALLMAKSKLQPMDIILEKSPFTLTDKFIPGHYGHVALYLGTKEQLENIGMWNHPSIIPHKKDIMKGKVILEAIRSGVQLSTLESFMNIDELTIVRKMDAVDDRGKVAEQVTRGMEQIGKQYDFNFDISTLDKIVCSELIYIVFGNISWPTRYRLGRATITPDDIGEILFQKNTRYKLTDYLISTKRHLVEKAGMIDLAHTYNYELRAADGMDLKNAEDPANSYWKRDIKCYNVSLPGQNTGSEKKRRTCKTTYKEFLYEESDL